LFGPPLKTSFFLSEMLQVLVCAYVCLIALDSRLETGYTLMKEKHADLSEQTDQFIVRFVEGKLLQELIVRLKNGYPTTEREAAVFDANQRKKEEHMRREAEKLIKVCSCICVRSHRIALLHHDNDLA
jgi:hypothetical protein